MGEGDDDVTLASKTPRVDRRLIDDTSWEHCNHFLGAESQSSDLLNALSHHKLRMLEVVKDMLDHKIYIKAVKKLEQEVLYGEFDG